MNRTLQPEDRIGHYQVVGPLGVGGMGEVYIAQDQNLERNVALKVLPADLVRNEERVRRFVTEAKAASSLNHPHIVTIYEIGQSQIKSGGSEEADPSSDSVHYISMELVQGETLQHKIHHEKTDLRTLLGYLAQVAEGLAKAHASGIVHRDLKPNNIMISRDGYAKVLDFGLAKLTERTQSEGEATLAATQVADLTGEGVVLGTAGYMSPEQVRGQAVDHRSDVFSFGCILYEAATRKRPFKADSDVETMHQILSQEPESVEQAAPEVPNAVRRLIKRCLAKTPDKRLSSMKDIAIQLTDIVEEFDALGLSGSGSSFSAPVVEAKRGLPMPAILFIVLVGLTGLGVGIWSLTSGSRGGGTTDERHQSFQSMQMESVVSARGISFPVLSSDGRYLAYVSGERGADQLWVRQVATGSQVKVAGPEPTIARISFSPDGNYLFFGMRDPETPNYTAIFSVPSLGGSPSKRIFDVDTAVSHSPDGKRACFRRGVPQEQRDHLVIADLAAGTERILAAIPTPLNVYSPVWSPDGQFIAWPMANSDGGYHSTLSIYPVEGGEPRELRLADRLLAIGVAWLPGSRQLVGSVVDITRGKPQLRIIDAQTGDTRRITNDLNAYMDPSVAEDGAVVAALRETQLSNLWTVDVRGAGDPRQITFGNSSEDYNGLSSMANGDILCSAGSNTASNIVRMSPDGTGLRRLSPSESVSFRASSSANVIVFGRAIDVLVPHLWGMDLDGGSTRQLTDGEGEVPGQISPDGTLVLFAPDDDPNSIWRQPLDGGEPTLVGPVSSGTNAQFSADGRYVLASRLLPMGERWVSHSIVYSIDGGDPVYTIAPPRPGMTNQQWVPGSQAISYQARGGPDGANVYRVSLDGSGDRALTNFPEGLVDWHIWSPDGAHLIVDRRVGSTVSIWVQRFENEAAIGEPSELASFPTGDIQEITWLKTKDLIVFRHVTSSRDVVLVRDFR